MLKRAGVRHLTPFSWNGLGAWRHRLANISVTRSRMPFSCAMATP